MQHESLTQPGLGNGLLNTTEARDRLDREIAALASTLCNLRTQRNTLSPISHLPPEILASIFVKCATHSPSLQRGRRTVPDWVNISYVCRQWRDVALNCSNLWSFVFVSSKHWTDELLARSKTAPLKVRINSDYTMQATELDLLKKVASQANRVQDLCLRLTRPGAEIVLPLLSSPAPLLRTLRVSVEKFNYLGEIAVVSEAPFDGHLPALRELELINYAFPLARTTLHGLTSLRLRDLGASFQPPLTSLLVALSQMQNLAHLHLENALPNARGGFINPSQNSEKLCFPKLSRLSIIAPLTTVVLLLSTFHIPLTAEVRLRCCFDVGVEGHSLLYPLLAKRFIASSDETATPPIIRASFVETASATVGFIFSATKSKSSHAFSTSTTSYDLDRLHEDWDCNIPLKVDIVLGSSLPLDREDVVSGVCRSVPLTDLQRAHFSFDSMTYLSSGFWSGIFGHLQKLTYIKLSGVNMHGLVMVLPQAFQLPNNQNGNLDSPVQVFAPALKKLEFYGMVFPKECRGHSEDFSNKYPCSIACFSDALSKRQARGYGLSQLVLAQCINIGVCDVGGLEGSVTRVVWDGVTRPVSHSSEDEY